MIFGILGAPGGAHGTTYRLMPETCMARHCIGLSHIAIGAENVGDGDKYLLTGPRSTPTRP